eukprot:6204305-Pleurochrysis_carterae.AAC.1
MPRPSIIELFKSNTSARRALPLCSCTNFDAKEGAIVFTSEAYAASTSVPLIGFSVAPTCATSSGSFEPAHPMPTLDVWERERARGQYNGRRREPRGMNIFSHRHESATASCTSCIGGMLQVKSRRYEFIQEITTIARDTRSMPNLDH